MSEAPRPLVHDDTRRTVVRTGLAVFAVFVVFVVALIVRLALQHTARFGGDEALFFRIGLDIVDGRAFPALGTQITDGAARLPGPAFLYVMALPLLVWRAPEAQYAFVEVLGAVTVVVQWHLLRRPFGERAALITGLLVACAPWSALYADRTWNPNVLPFFETLALLAALRVRASSTSRWGIALFPLLAVLPQLHTSAPVAVAGVLVVAGTALRRMPRAHVVLGLALAGALYLPLAVHEFTTGFLNTRNLLAETIGRQGGERHPWGFVWVPVYALRFLTLDVTYHELTAYWGGPDEWRCLRALLDGSAARPFHPLRFFALSTSMLLAVAAIAGNARAAWRARTLGVFGAAFVAALVVNTGLMAATAKQVFGHYVTCLFPFVVVAWAAGFSRWRGRALAVASVAAFVVGLGGIEATWSVSRNVDARIGLGVHRCVAAHVVETAAREGERRAALAFRGVHGSAYDWQIFIAGVVDPGFVVDRRARVRFAVTPAGAPRPADARTSGDSGDAVDCGAAQLWRLR